MRWLAALVALGACDRALGLGPTQLADGMPIAFTCPPIGATPQYYPTLLQVIDQPCNSYSFSTAGLAMAYCTDGVDQHVSTGPRDQPLVAASGFDDPVDEPVEAVIGGDGTAIITYLDTNTRGFGYRTYTQVGGAWQAGSEVLPETGSPNQPYVIAGMTLAHHVIYANPNDATLHELADDGAGTWTEPRPPIAAPDLGMSEIFIVAITSDGLRLLLGGYPVDQNVDTMFYTDRPSTDVAFRPAEVIDGVPFGDAFLSDDCARVYVTGLDRVFYLQQI